MLNKLLILNKVGTKVFSDLLFVSSRRLLVAQLEFSHLDSFEIKISFFRKGLCKFHGQ